MSARAASRWISAARIRSFMRPRLKTARTGWFPSPTPARHLPSPRSPLPESTRFSVAWRSRRTQPLSPEFLACRKTQRFCHHLGRVAGPELLRSMEGRHHQHKLGHLDQPDLHPANHDRDGYSRSRKHEPVLPDHFEPVNKFRSTENKFKFENTWHPSLARIETANGGGNCFNHG